MKKNSHTVKIVIAIFEQTFNLMKRRDFLKGGSLALGGLLLTPAGIKAGNITEAFGKSKAKNIIFLVSDGMSSGTLAMADLLKKRKFGKSTHWMEMYESGLVQRGLMDMASANQIITDSAAASSSWGGGVRVPNGSLNIGANGEEHLPILQKFKKAGKKVGCVTTVPVTHATPAGFSIYTKSRNSQEKIAELYLEQKFDVMLGGGHQYFGSDKRKDGVDMYQKFKSVGYSVARNKAQMLSAPLNQPLLGTFADDGMPYSVDHASSAELKSQVPTLAEMTKKAIDLLSLSPNGFVMQVEGGKVDWAAHGNDISGLIYDQLAFDDAIKVALDFAKKDGNTLVVVTTDHSNANPGLLGGAKTNENFDRVQRFEQSNEWILQGISKNDSLASIRDRVAKANAGQTLSEAEAKQIHKYYQEAEYEDGMYNPRKLPFKLLADIQKNYTSAGWISMDHSSDYVELAMYGPGSQLMKPFMKNTEIHTLLLQAAEIENKF